VLRCVLLFGHSPFPDPLGLVVQEQIFESLAVAMVNQAYLPAIVPVTLGVYLLVVVLVVYIFHRQERRFNDSAERPTLTAALLPPTKQLTLVEEYFAVSPFERTYQSLNPYGGRFLLLVTRALSFCYIFGISGLWNWYRQRWTNFFYFTHWNLIMISVYYASVTLSSIVGIIFNAKFRARGGVMDNSWFAVESSMTVPEESPYWSVHAQRLGFIIQVLYEVAGGSAFFITVIAFTFLNPQFSFWNVNSHFITSMAFLLEMAQNAMIVRWHHVLLNMFWAVLYLLYIWPAVASGAVTQWPYDFLQTANAGCFGWYFVLFLGNVIFYFLWYYLSRVKYECVYAKLESAKGVLLEHYRMLGHQYPGDVHGAHSGSGGSADFALNQSERGFLPGSTASEQEEMMTQESPLDTRKPGVNYGTARRGHTSAAGTPGDASGGNTVTMLVVENSPTGMGKA
jgi:hypothetical protein